MIFNPVIVGGKGADGCTLTFQADSGSRSSMVYYTNPDGEYVSQRVSDVASGQVNVLKNTIFYLNLNSGGSAYPGQGIENTFDIARPLNAGTFIGVITGDASIELVIDGPQTP